MCATLPSSPTWAGSATDKTGCGQDLTAGRLLFAGCGEKRLSQPVRFRLAGGPDSRRNISRLIGTQPHSEDRSKCVFLRQPRASHFPTHKKRVVVNRKLLTIIYFAFTKSLVSKFETQFCQKSARTSLARLANQGHPARTGAGRERLAMEANTFQPLSSGRQSRSLKVEAIGDAWRGKIIPRIRIAGQWLERAGFKPDSRVQVLIQEPGTITLRFVEEAKGVTL